MTQYDSYNCQGNLCWIAHATWLQNTLAGKASHLYTVVVLIIFGSHIHQTACLEKVGLQCFMMIVEHQIGLPEVCGSTHDTYDSSRPVGCTQHSGTAGSWTI